MQNQNIQNQNMQNQDMQNPNMQNENVENVINNDTNHKSMRKEKSRNGRNSRDSRIRRIAILCTVISLLAVMITGCGLATPLADGFDSDEVSVAAQHAIEVLNTGDLDAFHELCRADLVEVLTDEVILDAIEQIMPDAGAFEKFTSVKMTGATDEGGEEYASVIVEARYENQKVTYTIGLDLNLELVGFYLR